MMPARRLSYGLVFTSLPGLAASAPYGGAKRQDTPAVPRYAAGGSRAPAEQRRAACVRITQSAGWRWR
jgi:hypothetical protein